MRPEWRSPGGTLLDQAGRVRGSHRFWPPHPGLTARVVEVWRQRYAEEVRADPRSWRIAPDLRPHLVVHSDGGSGLAGVRVVGARSVHLDRPVGSRAWSAGVSLRPGTLPALVRLPASDLRDRSADTEEVWGAAGRRLSERIRSARGPEEVLGISARSLREVWSREVGLSPREALSIARLRGALRRAVLDPRASWSRIAPESGYAGQAHLIRDAHRYLGETPGDFLARGRPAAGAADS